MNQIIFNRLWNPLTKAPDLNYVHLFIQYVFIYFQIVVKHMTTKKPQAAYSIHIRAKAKTVHCISWTWHDRCYGYTQLGSVAQINGKNWTQR